MQTFSKYLMPIHTPLGFAPAFYSTGPERVASASPIVTPVSSDKVSTPSISYSGEQYRSNFEFECHADFAQFKAQFAQGFAKINEFCEQHEMTDRAQLRKDFDIFLTRRFARVGRDLHFFSGVHLELVDGPGKRAFDEMVAMLDDDKIDLQDKKAAVRALAEGVTVCAPGVGTNMMLVSRDLSLAAGGLRAAVWRTKEAIVQAEVTQAATAKFGRDAYFANNQIHYYSAIRNYLGPALGFPRIDDPFAQRGLEIAFLERCRAQVTQALTPVNIATHLAEECHAQFGQQLAAQLSELASDQESSSRVYRYDGDAQEAIDEAFNKARKQFGASLNQRSFVQVDAGYEKFHLLPQATLVFTDILEALDQERLLKGSLTPAASWIDPEGKRATAYAVDDQQLWLVHNQGDRSQQIAPTTRLGRGTNTERLLFDLPMALQLADHFPPVASVCGLERGPSYGEALTEARTPRPLARTLSTHSRAAPHPPVGQAWRQAILTADQTQLMQFPAASVGRAGMIPLLFSRLNPQQAIDYLTTHAAHFSGLQLDRQARAELADSALPALAEVPQVLQALYRNPWLLMNERPTETGPSRLATAMHKNDVACVNALARCHEQLSGAGRTVASKLDGDTILATLVAADPNGTPALNLAMSSGNSQVIPAWGRILTRAALLEQLGDRLGELLAAKNAEDGSDTPAMWSAAQRDHPSAITAWGNVVLELASFGRIQGDLLMDLLASKETSTDAWAFTPPEDRRTTVIPAMWAAASRGNASAITALGKIFLAPVALRYIQNHLTELLAAKDADGRPAVWVAAKSGNECFRAYLEVIEAAAPHLTAAQIKALLRPCRAVFTSTSPGGAASWKQCSQTFLDISARIAAASNNAFTMSDVDDISKQGPSGPPEDF